MKITIDYIGPDSAQFLNVTLNCYVIFKFVNKRYIFTYLFDLFAFTDSI